MRNGKYAAWFRTPVAQGTGVVHLTDGRISGSDSFFTYGGTYRFADSQHFTAVLTTRRYAEGPPTVFGLDEVEVELAGVCSGALATCSGKARQVPDVMFEVTLIYCQEDAPTTEPRRTVLKLNDKLPKGLDNRSGQRQLHVPPKPPIS